MTDTLSHTPEIENSLRWDWYQATVRDDRYAIAPESLPDALGESLGAASRQDDRGLYGYSTQSLLRSAEGSVICRVLHGGSNRWPNAWASGDHAPAFASVMRQQFKTTHAVTRADVAYDVQAPDAFDRLQAVCLRIADDRGLAVSQAGDWHRGVNGRTLYVGSRKSPHFIRLYEKGLEQVAKAPNSDAAALVPADWIRLELVVKPEKLPRRRLAASASRSELFGFSLWTKQLAQAVFSLDVPRVERASFDRPDDAVTLDWMIRQYSALLARENVRQGSWESVGRRLGRLVERYEGSK